jgi:hypothetical protein
MTSKRQVIPILLTALILLGCNLTRATIEETVAVPTLEATRITPQFTEVEEKSTDRWMIYEDALASHLLSLPNVRGAGYCEWEILGQEGQEIYLWAICQVAGDPEGSATSAPVVVTLANYGGIERVDMPRDGTLYGEDIRSMFPKELQNIIFDQNVDVEGMWAHIQSRHTDPEPPLIALANMPLP